MVTSAASPPLDRLLRRAAGLMPTGLALLSHGDAAVNVTTLHCLSCDPPVVSVCLDPASPPARAIAAAGRFSARVLREGDAGCGRDLATPPLDPPLVVLTCEIFRVERIGDHDLVLARVTRAQAGHGTPLVYWRRGCQALRLDHAFLATPAAFAAFIDAWEAGTWPREQWSHAAHVAVGACYAVRHGGHALDRTRAGILRYNQAAGTANTDTSGYHETLTRFWSEVVARLTAGCTDEWNAARAAVARVGEDRDLHTLCYAGDIVRSREARRAWVAPDWSIDAALALTAAG